MNTLYQLLLEYQADLKINRLSYSDLELQRMKQDIKQAYSLLKESDSHLHQNSEFMHAYKSVHGLIQHELKERKLDYGYSIDEILAGEGEVSFRDSALRRAERKIRQGDYSHTPREYNYLCEVVANNEPLNYSSLAIQHLREKKNSKKSTKKTMEQIVSFDQFVNRSYVSHYKSVIDSQLKYPIEQRLENNTLPVAEQITALEELVSSAQDFNSHYHAETLLNQWMVKEAPRRLIREDFSGLNRVRLNKLRNYLFLNPYKTGTDDLFGLPVVRRGEAERKNRSLRLTQSRPYSLSFVRTDEVNRMNDLNLIQRSRYAATAIIGSLVVSSSLIGFLMNGN